MILTSVKVENFKAVEDSTEFSIKPVTCLVGKNEAGKTTILQALYKLNPDIPEKTKFNDLLDYPRRRWSTYKERRAIQPDNVLTTKWDLQKTDIELIDKKFGLNVLKSTTVVVTKAYDNKLKWNIEIDEKQLLTNWLHSKSFDDTVSAEASKYTIISEITEALGKKTNRTDAESKLMQAIQVDFPEGAQNAIANLLKEHLPVFLFFSDFYKMLGKVSLTELINLRTHNRLDMGYKIFEALLSLAGTDADNLNKIGTFEELRAELEAISNRISQEIFEYWSQNRYLQVSFHFESGRPQDPPPFNNGFVFHTRILNNRHGVTVSFDERSAGFVWFFSFLVWFSQLKRTYGNNLLILLDDPGLSLHAKAQADLLRYIKEKLEPHYQVIYTTHSPFMIDPENLLSVRTVEDFVTPTQVLGTKVLDQVLGVDHDTVFPLQAALGYDITQTLFMGKHVLLVEGPGDLLYLKLFSKALQDAGRESLDHRWVITPCGGIEKIGSFMALFGGNNLHVAVFTDFHLGGKTRIRTLKESNLLKAGHVFTAEMYTDTKEADIEDVIGRSNYIKLVNDCYSLKEANSIPETKTADAPVRVVEEIESYLKSKGTGIDYDHYTPAVFLTENRKELDKLPQTDQALDRFERIFKDINLLLKKSR